MKWFKHLSGSGDDQLIMDAISLFGSDAYYVYFRILEIMSDEFSIDHPGENTFLVKTLRKKLQISLKKTLKILQFFAEKKAIFWRLSGKGRKQTIYLNCPKLKQFADEYTQRLLKEKSGDAPDTDRESLRPIEAEVEVENTKVEVENTKETSSKEEEVFNLPSKEEISESSIPKIKSDLQKVADHLYKASIFPQAHAFKNSMLKQRYNERAIMHAFCRCAIKKPPAREAWGYCLNIVKVETGNYSEKDYRKTTKGSS